MMDIYYFWFAALLRPVVRIKVVRRPALNCKFTIVFVAVFGVFYRQLVTLASRIATYTVSSITTLASLLLCYRYQCGFSESCVVGVILTSFLLRFHAIACDSELQIRLKVKFGCGLRFHV